MILFDWLSDNWFNVITASGLIATFIFSFIANRRRKKETADLRQDRIDDFGQTFEIQRVIFNHVHCNLRIDLSNKNGQKPLDILRVALSDDDIAIELEFRDAESCYFLPGQVKSIYSSPLYKNYKHFANKKDTGILTITDGYGVVASETCTFGSNVIYDRFERPQ
jgi:hypothetical protein